MKCYSCMKNNTLCDVHALGTWMAVLGLSNGDDNSVNPNNQVTAFMKFSFPFFILLKRFMKYLCYHPWWYIPLEG